MAQPHLFRSLWRCLATTTAVITALSSQARHLDSLDRDPIRIGEVVVTGTRSRTDVRHLPMTVTVVSRSDIEQAMRPSLLPTLTEQVPGLFTTARGVLGYGVSGGAAGGISLRGLSGGTGRLMVLIDGHPQYMGLMGHPIADAYQSLMADRVEVLRGPASVLYGSNAMGGVVNIVTRRPHEQGVQTDLTAGYGSFNTLEAELSNRVRTGRFTSSVNLSYNRTDGHRPRMGFQQYGGYARFGYDLTEAWNLRADVQATRFDASNPGETTAPLLDADQVIVRGMTSLCLANEYERTSGAVSLFYNWGRHKINDGHSPEEAPKAFRFHSRDRMLGISWHQSMQFFTGNRLTAGFDWYRFGGEAWNRFWADRHDEPIEEKRMDEVAGYVDFRQDIGSWLTLDAALRADRHSHVGLEWVPQFGLSFHLPRAVEMKLSASKGFRFPTLREMYLFPPQNPDLRPERMWNYELSVGQRFSKWSYGINLFYIDGDNLIQTVMAGGRPHNVNTGAVRNTGIEVETAWHPAPAWRLDANYSFLHMEHPVVGAPEHKLYAGAARARGRWMVSTGVQYIRGLHTETGTEEFVLWNLRASFRAAKWLSLWVRGENLLAQRYEINAGFPMPRATVMGGVKVSF